ncbi:4Fe-4S binding protein, partial [Myxococcota bacterium]|nr:4Fe-4S binding protein [Myxococcota bacterium]
VVTSCTFPVKEGLEIETDTPRVQTNRKVLMELLQARAPESKELKDMAVRIGLKSGSSFEPVEGSDCILCGLCVRVCDEVVGVNAINFNGRGGEMHVGGPLMTTPEACIGCGACVYVCPVDCIKMVDTAEERVIVKWDRHLPLKKCESCGWPFMPNFQALQFKKMADIPREFFTKCQDCRR